MRGADQLFRIAILLRNGHRASRISPLNPRHHRDRSRRFQFAARARGSRLQLTGICNNNAAVELSDFSRGDMSNRDRKTFFSFLFFSFFFSSRWSARSGHFRLFRERKLFRVARYTSTIRRLSLLSNRIFIRRLVAFYSCANFPCNRVHIHTYISELAREIT